MSSVKLFAVICIITPFSGVCLASGIPPNVPRTIVPFPVGTKLANLTYVGVKSNTTLYGTFQLVDGIDITINSVSAVWMPYIDLNGRTAMAQVMVPWAHFSGDVSSRFDQIANLDVTRSGLADPVFRLFYNFKGAPAMNLEQYAHYQQDEIITGAFSVLAPLGQYDSNKLVNLGSNRWQFKPELLYGKRLKRWFLEGYTGVLFSTTNNDFLGGRELSQNPAFTLDAYIGYDIQPTFWVTLGLNQSWTGKTSVDGVERNGSRSVSLLGLTVSKFTSKTDFAQISFQDVVSGDDGPDYRLFQFQWNHLF